MFYFCVGAAARSDGGKKKTFCRSLEWRDRDGLSQPEMRRIFYPSAVQDCAYISRIVPELTLVARSFSLAYASISLAFPAGHHVSTLRSSLSVSSVKCKWK